MKSPDSLIRILPENQYIHYQIRCYPPSFTLMPAALTVRGPTSVVIVPLNRSSILKTR